MVMEYWHNSQMRRNPRYFGSFLTNWVSDRDALPRVGLVLSKGKHYLARFTAWATWQARLHKYNNNRTEKQIFILLAFSSQFPVSRILVKKVTTAKPLECCYQLWCIIFMVLCLQLFSCISDTGCKLSWAVKQFSPVQLLRQWCSGLQALGLGSTVAAYTDK